MPHLPHIPLPVVARGRRTICPLAWLLGLLLLAGTGLQEVRAHTSDGAAPLPLITQQWTVSMPGIDVLEAPYGEGAERINQAIRERARALIAELASMGDVSGDYRVHLDQAGVVSVTLQYSGYGAYMAHPMHVRASITADAATGTVYSLADLFRDDGYIDVISQEVLRGLEEWDLPTVTEFEKIAPDQPFYLTPTSLVVYFQLYELLPYAAGFPEFEIPYAHIADMAADDGPIARLMRQGR